MENNFPGKNRMTDQIITTLYFTFAFINEWEVF